MRHDVATVAYQQQQQQTGYPPATHQRSQQPYGNTSGTPTPSYAPNLAHYYGAQQRA